MRSIIVFVVLLVLFTLAAFWFHAGAADCYVDSRMTGNGDDGTSQQDAFLTLEQAVEIARTAGDTVFVCGAHEETLGSHISVLSDGTGINPIVIWGDSGTKWATVPTASIATITCNAFYLSISGDKFWQVNRLKLKTMSVFGINLSSLAHSPRITNCEFDGLAADADYAINISSLESFVEGCVFTSGGNGRGIYASGGRTYIKGCTFDNLAAGILLSSATAHDYGSEYGQTQANVGADVSMSGLSWAYMHDCVLNDRSKLYANGENEYIYLYERDAKERPTFFVENLHYTLESDYSVARSGGAAYSLKAHTIVDVGHGRPVKLFEYAANCDSATAREWTVYAIAGDKWATATTTASNFYLEALYAGPSRMASATSTATFTSASTWTAFTVSTTPGHDGPVTLSMWLKKTDADGALYMDPQLVTDTPETYDPTHRRAEPTAQWLAPAAAGGGQIILIGEKQKPPAVWQWLASAGGVR